MSPQLDSDIRSVFDDIVGTTPELGDAPDPTLAPVIPIDRHSRRAVWLAPVAAAFVLTSIGGVLLVQNRDAGPAEPLATEPSIPTETIEAPRTTPSTTDVVPTAPPSTAVEPSSTAPAPSTSAAPATTAVPATTAPPVTTTAAPATTTTVVVTTTSTTHPPLIDDVLFPPFDEELVKATVDPNGESQQFQILAWGDVDGDGDDDAIAAAQWCGASCTQSVDLVLNEIPIPVVYTPAGYSQWDFRTFLPWFITGSAVQSNATAASISPGEITLTGTSLCGETPPSDIDGPGTCNINTVRTATYSYTNGVVAPVSINPPLG